MKEGKDLTKEEKAIILNYIFNGAGTLPDIMPFIELGEEGHYHELRHMAEDFPHLLKKNPAESQEIINAFKRELRKADKDFFEYVNGLVNYEKLCLKKKRIINPWEYAEEILKKAKNQI